MEIVYTGTEKFHNQKNMNILGNKNNIFWFIDFDANIQMLKKENKKAIKRILVKNLEAFAGDAELSLSEILYNAIKSTREEIIADDTLLKMFENDEPVFSVSMLKEKDGVLEYLMLGDNMILIQNRVYVYSKNYSIFKENFQKQIDNVGKDKSKIVEIQLNAKNELLNNDSPGMIASLNEDCVFKALTGMLTITPKNKIAILSSSFYDYFKNYKIKPVTFKLSKGNIDKMITFLTYNLKTKKYASYIFLRKKHIN